MIELLTQFSLLEIISVICLTALAIKGFLNFWDWASARLRKFFNKENAEEQHAREQKEHLSNVDNKIEKLTSQIAYVTERVNLLISSDKDDIKSFITKEHHHFCYDIGWIDDYSLDCLEKRYEHYKEEDGNSFVEGLMHELRNLPKHPPTNE